MIKQGTAMLNHKHKRFICLQKIRCDMYDHEPYNSKTVTWDDLSLPICCHRCL